MPPLAGITLPIHEHVQPGNKQRLHLPEIPPSGHTGRFYILPVRFCFSAVRKLADNQLGDSQCKRPSRKAIPVDQLDIPVADGVVDGPDTDTQPGQSPGTDRDSWHERNPSPASHQSNERIRACGSNRLLAPGTGTQGQCLLRQAVII